MESPALKDALKRLADAEAEIKALSMVPQVDEFEDGTIISWKPRQGTIRYPQPMVSIKVNGRWEHAGLQSSLCDTWNSWMSRYLRYGLEYFEVMEPAFSVLKPPVDASKGDADLSIQYAGKAWDYIDGEWHERRD